VNEVSPWAAPDRPATVTRAAAWVPPSTQPSPPPAGGATAGGTTASGTTAGGTTARRVADWYQGPARPVAGWPPPTLATPRQPPGRTPSGLFPAQGSHPVYREPTPVGFGLVLAGFIGGALWMMLFGLLASNARGYIWLTIIAGGLAWVIAVVLARYGDRGVAVGVAVATSFALTVATIVVIARWAGGVWLLW
jgi:hypothetical protein